MLKKILIVAILFLPAFSVFAQNFTKITTGPVVTPGSCDVVGPPVGQTEEPGGENVPVHIRRQSL